MAWLTTPSIWYRRKPKLVKGSTAGAQTNYQLKLTVYKGSGIDTVDTIYLGGYVNDDFSDLRFTSSDETTLLPYWIESYISGVSAVVWVKIDSIPADPFSKFIYIYYDNLIASPVSNGTNTFVFFDDFPYTAGSFASNSKWTKYVGGNYYAGSDVLIENEKLKLHIAGACYACYGEAGVYSTNTFSTSYPIVIKYVSSPVTKTFFGDWNQGEWWDNGFLMSTNAGYPSATGNNYFLVYDNAHGDFYIRSHDTVTARALYTETIGNIAKNIEIKIDSTNVIVTLNGVVKYNGPHYLNTSNRYIHLHRYADQRTWIDQTYDNLSVRKYASPEPIWDQSSPEQTYTANLTVSSTPSGAEIWINDVDQGVTTTGWFILNPGTYTIMLTKPGYEDYIYITTLESNVDAIVQGDLISTTGNLDISSTPSGAEIFLAPTGLPLVDQGIVTPNIISLSPLTYDYKLTHIDYYDITGSFTITAGSTTTLNIPLAPLACPIVPKYSGNTVTLKTTPKDGTGPYYVEFRKNGTIIDPPRLGGLDNPILNAPENIQITRVYTLDDLDISSALLGTIDFSVYITDSCPTGAKTCTDVCTITIGCIAPICNFTVT